MATTKKIIRKLCTGGLVVLFVLGLAMERGAASDRLTQFQHIRHFMYQIQNLQGAGSVDALATTHYDLLIVEPTNTVFGEESFDVEGMVKTLQSSANSQGGRKLVLAYVDIGEAEDYRTYWQEDWVAPSGRWEPGEPDFLVTTDPDGWSGNYPVAYWDPRWQRIVLDDVLQNILDAGFDGIYYDWVEAYDDDVIIDRANLDGVDAPTEMVRFLRRIRNRARATDPEFLCIQQNAPYLIEETTGLTDVIDGFAMEDTWFSGSADVAWDHPNGGDIPNTFSGDFSTAALLKIFQQYKDAGMPVMTVDYSLKPANANFVYQKALQENLMPLVTRSSLWAVTPTPSPAYLVDDPLPDIKANGLDHSVAITPGDNISITVNFNPGSHSGENADWWIAAYTPFDWFYFDIIGDSWYWRPGLFVTHQGPLFNLSSPFEVLNISGLPEGTYTFYFAVDMNANSVLDINQLHYDAVSIKVAPTTP